MNFEIKSGFSEKLNSPVSLNWERVIVMTLLILTIVASIFGFSYFYFLSTLENDLSVNGVSFPLDFQNDSKGCGDNHVFYKHDVVGISFCYPSEWGEVVVEPKSNITSLEGLVDEFDDEDNYYLGSFLFSFSKNQDISMRFFNDKYKGQKYPNANAYAYGYVDNIDELKRSGDICEYCIDFETEYQSKMRENDGECNDGIKTVVIENEEHFDKVLYQTSLHSFAFEKLNNEYFNNLLIDYNHGSAGQRESRFDNIDALVSGMGKTKDDFKKEQFEFAGFVTSIKTFVPKLKTKEAFQEVDGEDLRITAIRKYYWFLSNGEFDKAYAMKLESSRESFEIFLDNYQNIYSAKSYDFKNISGDTFKFYVDYQDINKPLDKYEVTMEIIDGKLKTVFSEKLVGDIARSGEYLAFSSEREGKSYVILKKGDQETIVDQGDVQYTEDFSNLGDVKSFSNINFSKDGSYLFYSMYGYEWSRGYVFDIANSKIVLDLEAAHFGENFNLTPDEDYLYYCLGNGMTEGVPGQVYSLPGFEKVFDVPVNVGDYMNYECRYDNVQKSIIFTMSNSYEENGESVKEVNYSIGN